MLKTYIRKYKKNNIWILLLGFLIAALQVFSAIIHTFAINELIKSKVINFLLWNILSLSLWGLLFILNYFKGIFEEKITQKISADIREDLANRISTTTYENFINKNEATFVSWFNNDLQQIEDKGIKQYYVFWDCIFQAGLSAIALISYHYSLILLTLILMGILMKFPVLFEKKMAKSTNEMSKANEVFLSKTQDVVSGYTTFFGYNKVNNIIPLIRNASEYLGKEKVHFIKVSKSAEGFIGIVNIFSQVAVVTYTGILAGLNIVSIGALSTTGSLASAIFNSISLGSSSSMMRKSVDAYFDKFQKFEINTNIKDEPLCLEKSIELKNINYNIGDKSILKNLNLKLEIGKKYAVVGDSGSGKSTLLNILSGRIQNFEGEIIVDGKKISETDIRRLSSITAYTSQNPHLFNDTVLNNITLWDDLKANDAIESLEKLEINSYINQDCMLQENGNNLSGGQKQRIALARSVIETDKLVLLDESTANLDKKTALLLENSFLEDPDSTVIIVTHHLYEENKHKFDQIIYLP